MSEDTRNSSNAFSFTKHPYFSTFLISVVFLGIITLSLRFYFHDHDDIYVTLLLKGAGMSPAPSEYNLLLNAFLSMGLKGLYARFPSIHWYSLFLVVTQALAFWALLLSCQLGTHKLFKTILTLASSCIYAYLITILQWTTVSSFAAIGGLVLLVALWQDKDRRPYPGLIALFFILLVLSVLIRPAAFSLICVVALPTVVYIGWKSAMTPTRSFILKFMVFTAAVILLVMGSNSIYYARDPAWANAKQFFNLHSELINGHRLHYEETTKPIFDSIGWTQNDLDLLLNWYFLDADTYSIENFEKLIASFTHFHRKENDVESPAVIFARPTIQCAFWSFLFLSFFLPRSRIKYMSVNVIWTTIVLGSLAVYLKVPERVFLPPILFLMNMAIFYAVPKGGGNASPRLMKSLGKLVIVFVLLMGSHTMIWERKVIEALKTRSDGLNEALKSFTPQKNELYVIWDGAFPYEVFGAFDGFDFFKRMNLVTLVWFQRTPTTQAILERFGVRNLFRDLVDNPKVFLICTPWEVNAYKAFMIQKHNMATEFKPTFSSPYFTAYQIQSAKPR